jgi:hypothetical protein
VTGRTATRAVWSDRERRVGRGAALLAAGAALGAGLALVGPPPSPRAADAPPGAANPAGEVAGLLDRAQLTERCRRVLDASASAEFLGARWWCAGRPGGVWRLEQLEVDDACGGLGRPDRPPLVTDEAVDCAP